MLFLCTVIDGLMVSWSPFVVIPKGSHGLSLVQSMGTLPVSIGGVLLRTVWSPFLFPTTSTPFPMPHYSNLLLNSDFT